MKKVALLLRLTSNSNYSSQRCKRLDERDSYIRTSHVFWILISKYLSRKVFFFQRNTVVEEIPRCQRVSNNTNRIPK